jgi:preprotein translocase subunit YajC
MGFFIEDAMAQSAAVGPDLMGMLPLVLIFAVFYFLLIRPQQKKQKEHKALVEALAVGDEVVTAGGVLGKVTELKEQFVRIEISDGVVITSQRQTISQVLPKGSIKSV